MNTVVARVQRVLTGHSSVAMIHAVDEHGHEHRLEVPVDAARDVAAGSVLVLQWSAHGLPGVTSDGPAIEVVPVEETPHVAEARATSTAGVLENAATHLEALLGLRPGRLHGAGSTELP